MLDAARRVPEKMEWAAAKDALIAGFETPSDRQRALRSFQTAQTEVGVNSLSHAVALRALLDRVLPSLNDAARSELLLERSVESLSDNLREKARMIQAGRAMDEFTLAEAVRQLTNHEVSALQTHEVPKSQPLEDVAEALKKLTEEVAALKSN
ncbi:unnamed protein product [Echinostoma caproni]|uniref:Type VI secretion system ATPase TssH n=1 Tax=Echinostoma caproni TaxID=27848 RepID=A0A183AIP2_9TREM|nr:unnamed protein product [Echinostoma caproni]